VAEPTHRSHRRCRTRAAASFCAVSVAALAAACASGSYSPYPLALDGGLPPDAFARCRELLLVRFGALAVDDEPGFRLQTAWIATANPPGERRATVYRERIADTDELAIVVELRRITVPLVGAPHWTESYGDDAAERALARELEQVLTAPVDDR
jgi:hypothetical protein